MPKSQLVAQHVPYLRRYARALTGSQASGDSYVVAALEALVKDQSVLDDSLNPQGCAVPAVFEDLEFRSGERAFRTPWSISLPPSGTSGIFRRCRGKPSC